VTAVSDLNESHLALALITDALFCSKLKTGDMPTGSDLSAAIREALKAHRGWDRRTRTVAAAFAKAPAKAAEREAWGRQLAEAALKSSDILTELSQME
jgi:hypothetical protein